MYHRHRAGECRKEQGNYAAWQNVPGEQNDKCIVWQYLQKCSRKSPCSSKNFTLRGAKGNVPFSGLCVLTFRKASEGQSTEDGGRCLYFYDPHAGTRGVSNLFSFLSFQMSRITTPLATNTAIPQWACPSWLHSGWGSLQGFPRCLLCEQPLAPAQQDRHETQMNPKIQRPLCSTICSPLEDDHG